MAELARDTILMLTCQMLPEVFGGAEQQCLRLCRELQSMGKNTHILTSVSRPDIPQEDMIEGVPISRIRVPSPPQLGGRKIVSSLLWFNAVERWIDARADKISLIHAHQAKLNAWAAVRNAKRLGRPSLVKLGSAGDNLDFYSLQRKKWIWGRVAAQHVARDASCIVTISNAMYEDARRYGIPEARCVLIPNGIDISTEEAASDDANALRSELGLSPDARALVFVGRMERQKNISTLLRAFAKLPQDLPRTHLILLGDGALLERHRKEAADLGIAERVRFEGRVTEVPRYLRIASLFVLPALAEGMSNAVLEAMRAGVPQVASAVSGNTDLIVEGETGWLYGPPEDEAALGAVLANALAQSDETLQTMGEAARGRVVEQFSIRSVARQYAALYDSLWQQQRLAS